MVPEVGGLWSGFSMFSPVANTVSLTMQGVLYTIVTPACKRISTVNVDHIATVFQQLFLALDISSPQDFHKYPWLDARIATDDLPDAYRGLPVCDNTRESPLSPFWPSQGGWKFMELFGLGMVIHSLA